MPNLYVLTITDFDPFGRDYMVYTFQNKCEEQPDLPYEDGLKFLYFNTKGKKGESGKRGLGTDCAADAGAEYPGSAGGLWRGAGANPEEAGGAEGRGGAAAVA